MSLDITQCHERTVPKLSQRRLLTPEIDDIAAGAWRGCAFDQDGLKAVSQQPVGETGPRYAGAYEGLVVCHWAANSSAESILRFSPLQVLTSVLSQYIDETQFGLAQIRGTAEMRAKRPDHASRAVEERSRLDGADACVE